jgi:predicted ribosomally synthesized peptide with SipW-like signal peptide
VSLVCVIALGALGSGVAWAWWSASANPTAQIAAATILPPTNVTCSVDSRLFFEDTVTIKWLAPPTPTLPTPPLPANATRTYTVTFVSASGIIVKTVPDGTLQLLVKWGDINTNGGWNQKQTITVRSSVAFAAVPATTPATITTTWVSAAATPTVASTGSTTLGYNNLACTTP